MKQKLFFVEDVMSIFGVCRGTVYALRRKGVLSRGAKVGRRIVWRASELQTYLDRVNGRRRIDLSELLDGGAA